MRARRRGRRTARLPHRRASSERSEIDSPFTGLVRDWQGRATARLSGSDGATAELWVDEGYEMLEVFTGDTLAPERRRTGLGLEPMTCAPDAFRSGEGLIRLGPGESTSATWGARLAA